jgi:phosphoglycerate dehydrogenase-like enzyme
MRVFYYDPRRQPEMENTTTYLELDELLSRCDIVSLHVAYTPETRNLIGERELALMKPGSILVNTSRGEVLDLQALAAALREGRLFGAGLDNYPGEPPPTWASWRPWRTWSSLHTSLSTPGKPRTA